MPKESLFNGTAYLAPAKKVFELEDLFSAYEVVHLDETKLVPHVSKIISGGSRFLVLDAWSTGGVFVFDEKGNFEHLIQSKGSGPDQYASLSDFQYSARHEKLFLMERSKLGFLTFDLNGKFLEKQSIKTDPGLSSHTFVLIDEADKLFFDLGYSGGHRIFRYDLITHESEKFLSLDSLYLKLNLSTNMTMAHSGKLISYISPLEYQILKFNTDGNLQGVIDLDLGDYHLGKDDLKALDDTRALSDLMKTNPAGITPQLLETEDYYWVFYQIGDFQTGFPSMNIIDKEGGSKFQFSELSYNGVPLFHRFAGTMDGNRFIVALNPEHINALSAEQRKRIEKLVPAEKEVANFILLIGKI
ncbi:6-bladed beta-propeller [Pararhodonellum marinum]|uniref:6-bladed beta-propeller n=1 Tax=Pararhodonellum marinum TaxID=2755358 RepID=UPI00188E37DA|nr:6-bladed beta-propeller [Pararhodonellum marinum]